MSEHEGERGELLIVTGMTGAGRSTAAKELEDLGWYVVDNLPPELVDDVVKLVDAKYGPSQGVAAVIDVRADVFFGDLREALVARTPTRRSSVLFLEADDDILVRRQEAARRPHPLQGDGRLMDGIARERLVLQPLRGDADLVIDTTGLTVHQLKSRVSEAYGSPAAVQLQITVLSFGFKYGVPVDGNLMADMRFLPNPYWVPELRPLTGRDPAIASYVLERPDAEEFLERYVPVVETIAEGYVREGKRFMTVAIGCTGGKHRSVATAEELARRLVASGLAAQAAHRDLGRE